VSQDPFPPLQRQLNQLGRAQIGMHIDRGWFGPGHREVLSLGHWGARAGGGRQLCKKNSGGNRRRAQDRCVGGLASVPASRAPGWPGSVQRGICAERRCG